MWRGAAAAFVAGCLLAAPPARAQDALPGTWAPQFRCDTPSGCADLDRTATATARPLRNADPLALASGTPGEPVEDLPDD